MRGQAAGAGVSEVAGGGKELLGVEEVAGYLGVATVTVYRWCGEGRLPCMKVGKSWRIRWEALGDFLSRGNARRSSWASRGVF